MEYDLCYSFDLDSQRCAMVLQNTFLHAAFIQLQKTLFIWCIRLKLHAFHFSRELKNLLEYVPYNFPPHG